MFSKVFLLVALGVVLQQQAAEAAEKKKVVCYQGTWATYRQGNGKFDVENIDGSLCTHLVYAFFGIQPNGSIRYTDPWLDLEDDGGRGNIKKFNAIKTKYPELKTLAAVGGWNEGSEKFSIVANDPALRKVFVKESVELLKKFNFNGLDLDWEYPNKRHELKNDDKTNFVSLAKELSEAFAEHGYILSAAVPAAQDSALASYDIPAISKYLTFINLMAYDLHGAYDGSTGFNAPLLPGPQDVTPVQKQLNVEAIVKFWLSQGAPAEKLILGVPFYGHTFTLANANEHGVGAPTTGPGIAGQYSAEAGTIGYNELCERMLTEPWNAVWDKVQKVPYVYSNTTWVSYDNIQSITLKAQYAVSKNLGGVMVWSLEYDDFRGECGPKNALLKAVNQSLVPSMGQQILNKMNNAVESVKNYFNGILTRN